jgi:ceramide glucosyltransferase
MALRRATLAQIGGMPALADHLADDNVLGALVRRLGLSVRLAPTLPVVVVQERRLAALWLHELRWARTIRAVAPLGFTAGVLQCFIAAWGLRAAVTCGIDHTLRGLRSRPAPRPAVALPALAMLPLRDILSVAVWLAGFWGDEVVWRGHVLRADHGVLAAEELTTNGLMPDESLQV